MMFLAYLKIAGRNFSKHRLYSSINVLGLALGLTCCLLIALYVLDETSFDNWHPDAERIYRLSQTYVGLDDPLYLDTSSPQAGPLLQETFTEVEAFTRMLNSTQVFSGQDGSFHAENVSRADASVFEFFAFDWVQGNPDTALAEPNSIVLTRTFARKYFGDAEPVGRTLLMGNENQVQLRVTGLIEDLPHNMHFTTSAFLSLSSLSPPDLLQNWDFANFATYLKLQPQVDYPVLDDAFGTYLLGSMPEPMSKDWGFTALKLPDIHLYAPLTGLGGQSSGNLANVVILVVIAVCILLLAGINFINLSCVSSLQRIKEIVVRKAIGSSHRQLFQQFMSESLFLVVISFMIALVLVEVMLPILNAFTGKQLTVSTLVGSWSAASLSLAVVLVIAFLAGCYPAMYLSALRPADSAMMGRGGRGKSSFRDLLVVFQFSVSIILVIATLIVYSQVQLGKTVELGFNKDQILVMSATFDEDFHAAWPAFKNELISHPQITAATTSSTRPFLLFVSQFDARSEEGAQEVQLTQIQVDYDFFETYQVPALAGRLFSESFGSERLVVPTDANPLGTASFILNRTAANLLGWSPEEAIGKSIERTYSEDFSRRARGPVIGVVENMRFESLHESIKPTFYVLSPDNVALDDISLRLDGNNPQEVLAFIDNTWTKFNPGQPIDRIFLDTDFQGLYKQEEKFTQLLSAFAFISILVSCLGLFGLASFNAERRTKEIGVRKVMGGSVWSIVLLLTNDFSKLVLISNVIAWPIAYFAMNRWLENFAYRIDLTPLIFIGSGLIALCIAWVTVGGTAAKAASQKPVLALRYE